MKKLADNIHNYLTTNRNNLAERIVKKAYADNPAYWNQFGDKGKQLSIRDAGYHLPFLSEAVISGQPDVFLDYILWVKLLFKGLNLAEDSVYKTLFFTKAVLKEDLPEQEYLLVAAVLDLSMKKLGEKVADEDSYLQPGRPLYTLAIAFNKALLEGNRQKANMLIQDAVSEGVAIRDIYLHVFQVSQYEVGRLWLANKISVAKEHFCTAATQQIMGTLYPHIFNTDRIGQTFIGASIGGELHELGIRMVADFFEMDGWDTVYLGANSPTTALLDAIEEHKPSVMGLSIAMPYHRSILKETIQTIRSSSVAKDVLIMVGGNALNRHQEALTDYNADGYAPDAVKAIELARKLIAA